MQLSGFWMNRKSLIFIFQEQAIIMKARHIACLLLCLGVSAHAQELDTCLHLHEVMVTGVTGTQRVSQVPAPVSTVSAT